jgi:hypothetical protein
VKGEKEISFSLSPTYRLDWGLISKPLSRVGERLKLYRAQLRTAIEVNPTKTI